MEDVVTITFQKLGLLLGSFNHVVNEFIIKQLKALVA
jgi:hypothetical protein